MAEGTNRDTKIKMGTMLLDEPSSSSEIISDSILPILDPNPKNSADKNKTANMHYACSICKKCFIDEESVQKHELTHNKQSFECPQCHKFFTSTYLKLHMRVHTDEKPYTCEQCGRTFRYSANFSKHVRLHTGEKPFACPFEDCNFRFTQKSHLNNHLMVHRGEKPHQCAECLAQFCSSFFLKRHQLSCKKDEPTSSTQTDDDQVPSCSNKQETEEMVDPNKSTQVSSFKDQKDSVDYSSKPNQTATPLLTGNHINRKIPSRPLVSNATQKEQVVENSDRWKDRSILGLQDWEEIPDEYMQIRPIDLSLSHSKTSNDLFLGDEEIDFVSSTTDTIEHQE